MSYKVLSCTQRALNYSSCKSVTLCDDQDDNLQRRQRSQMLLDFSNFCINRSVKFSFIT